MELLDYQQLKSDVHRALLAKVDLEKLSTVNNGQARHAIVLLIQDIVAKERVPLSAMEKEVAVSIPSLTALLTFQATNQLPLQLLLCHMIWESKKITLH
jgi:hypothetical protein